MDEEARRLVQKLREDATSPGDTTYLRRGVVASFTSTTATVTISGVNVPGVRYYKHVTLTNGDSVDVLFDGPSPRILGVLR